MSSSDTVLQFTLGAFACYMLAIFLGGLTFEGRWQSLVHAMVVKALTVMGAIAALAGFLLTLTVAKKIWGWAWYQSFPAAMAYFAGLMILQIRALTAWEGAPLRHSPPSKLFKQVKAKMAGDKGFMNRIPPNQDISVSWVLRDNGDAKWLVESAAPSTAPQDGTTNESAHPSQKELIYPVEIRV